jgi:hypothetical protein
MRDIDRLWTNMLRVGSDAIRRVETRNIFLKRRFFGGDVGDIETVSESAPQMF